MAIRRVTKLVGVFGALVVLVSALGCATQGVATPDTPDGPGQALTPDPTPDSCTGWWCTATVVVYGESIGAGNELEGATITLDHTSYCSTTRGRHQATTGPDGRASLEVFFHDTDRIRIWVEAEGYEQGAWDSRDIYCLFCNCFYEPLEIVLERAPSP